MRSGQGYAGADHRQSAICRLAAGATLVWVDALVARRVERGERWAFARHESRLRVERAGRLVLFDGLLLDPEPSPAARASARSSGTSWPRAARSDEMR